MGWWRQFRACVDVAACYSEESRVEGRVINACLRMGDMVSRHCTFIKKLIITRHYFLVITAQCCWKS